ncbi:hypothetical protein BASA81_004103 [Batrachochytrium salamandrivorans]|nr:hypothetical protein BASA81_004103 [Batrachochytrium salamandrivorans]
MKICLIEPYYGGSHATLVDLLGKRYPNHELFSMRAKKWHWKLRASALTFSQQIPLHAGYDVLFASSMVNLADLLALRVDLQAVPNIILYCHENQLEYPKQSDEGGGEEERDHYFAHANIMSCLVAKQVLFNSSYNLESFLGKIPAFFNHLPMDKTCRPEGKRICDEIRAKSKVLFMLIDLPISLGNPNSTEEEGEKGKRPLRIGFPHRWEHDKDPAMFVRVLQRLREKHCAFTVRVFGGEAYENVSIQDNFAKELGSIEMLEQCGKLESRAEYLQSLAQCDVVVSTARHEFFGVSMVEASLLGCAVLCPNRLAYPEVFDRSALYNTEAQLVKALQSMCINPPKFNHTVSQLLPGMTSKVDINRDGGLAFDQAVLHFPQPAVARKLLKTTDI